MFLRRQKTAVLSQRPQTVEKPEIQVYWISGLLIFRTNLINDKNTAED